MYVYAQQNFVSMKQSDDMFYVKRKKDINTCKEHGAILKRMK